MASLGKYDLLQVIASFILPLWAVVTLFENLGVLRIPERVASLFHVNAVLQVDLVWTSSVRVHLNLK